MMTREDRHPSSVTCFRQPLTQCLVSTVLCRVNMNGMTSVTGGLCMCMPVVAMMEVAGQQEPKARIVLLPLANGSLKLHAALLRSMGLA